MKLTKAQKTKQKTLYDKMVSPEPYKPKARLTVQAADLPEIKGWDVGETYTLKLEAKMVSKSEGGYDGNQPMEATFEIDKTIKHYDDDEDDD
jgi:hypothetical protein